MTRTDAPASPPDLGYAGAAALVADYADDLVLSTVRDVHEAVARRWFGLTNRATAGAAESPKVWHDRVTGAVYAGIGLGIRAAAGGLRIMERFGLGPRLEAGPTGRKVLSVANGLVGDRLVVERPELAIPMAVRRDGADVPLGSGHLASAFPHATGDLVVFLHGLCENDDAWEHRRGKAVGTYGSRLADTTSWTPVYLRANTGLPVTENAVMLAALLDDLVGAWPTEVRRIALVGHSMGGLIMRAACAVVTEAEAPWTRLVTNVVTLGTPHLGAPLERAAHAGARVLGVVPESAPFGRILEYRSVGILDLRCGLAADLQHLPHARYHLVAATLTDSPRHPVSEMLGDLLVRYPSAVGKPRRGPEMFPGADVLHVPGADHFALLNHPDVFAALEVWLG